MEVYTSRSEGASVFDVLCQEIPLEQLLQVNGHRKIRCISPSHEDKDPSTQVYDDHVHCFGCGFHGDVVDVWGVQKGINSPIEAALDLAREFNIRLPEASPEAAKKSEERRQAEEENLSTALALHHALERRPEVREWWEGRGFGEELQERFLLGATYDGATIPFWHRGRIKGIIKRKLEGEPKYILPKAEEFPEGHKPLFIPGDLKDELFLVEGYIDALPVAATGKSVIAVGGTGISATQATEIRNLNLSRITILPDNDGEGEQAARKWGRQFFPQARIAPPDYAGTGHKDIADLFAATDVKTTSEHLDRLVEEACDMIDIETGAAAEIQGGPREKLAYATEHFVPLLAKIHPAGMQDATADIVARAVPDLQKTWLTKAIKDETERLEGEAMSEMIRAAEEEQERRSEEHCQKVAEAQPEIDELFAPGVLARLRDTASKVHRVERDERPLEMAILVALGAQLAPLPNGRPSGASSLLTADAGRGKNHLADAAVELLPEEFYEAFEIVSSQAFYYGVENDPDFLRHTFVYPNEIEGVEALIEFLRPMLSKGWCKKHVTDKDPISGRNVMRTIIVEGPVTTIIPTIRNKTDDQLQTRLLMAELEDYLGRVKIHSKAISNLYHPDHASADFTRERFLWVEGLRQLTQVRRVVFRIDHEDFAYDDDQVSHGARLWANLLGLMSAHAWLEQKNRRVLNVGDDEVAIEATPDDYEAAYNVFTQVCQRTTVNLSETHRKILNGLWKCSEDDPGRDGFTVREIGAAGGISFQAVSKHKTYLVSSAKLVGEGDAGLFLLPGVTQAEWLGEDITRGLPSPDQVRGWWTGPDPPPDGDGSETRRHRGQASQTGQNGDTYAESSVHAHRGQIVDTSTGNPEGNSRGHVHGLSTEGVDSENGIGKPHQGNGDTLSTVSTPSGRVPLSSDLKPDESATLAELKRNRLGGGLVTHVVNVKGRKKGTYSYVGRDDKYGNTYFGNPYEIGKHGTREQVLEKYKLHLAGLLATDKGQAELERVRKDVEAGLPLGCHCAGKEGTPPSLTKDDPLHCHGQLVLRVLWGAGVPLLEDEEEL